MPVLRYKGTDYVVNTTTTIWAPNSAYVGTKLGIVCDSFTTSSSGTKWTDLIKDFFRMSSMATIDTASSIVNFNNFTFPNSVIPDTIIINLGYYDFNAGTSLGSFSGVTPTSVPTSGLENAYAYIIKNFQTNYPNAKIFVCLFSQLASANEQTSTTINANLVTYNNSIQKVCDFYGVKTIDLNACGIYHCNKNSYGTKTSGRFYPNQAGNAKIAEKIEQSLLFG